MASAPKDAVRSKSEHLLLQEEPRPRRKANPVRQGTQEGTGCHCRAKSPTMRVRVPSPIAPRAIMRCPGPVTRRVDPLKSADLMVAVAGIGALGIRAVLVRLDPTLSSLA